MYVLSKKNKNYRSYIGMGYFNTILPVNTKKYFRKSWMVYYLYSLSGGDYEED